MSAWEIVGTVYGVGLALQLSVGILFMLLDNPNYNIRKMRRTGARLILTCLAWPALVVLFVSRGMAVLIRIADLKEWGSPWRMTNFF